MKLLFIIAHKYYRNYETYTEKYIKNVQNFYNKDADILIVDNNSININDIEKMVSKYENVKLIINTSDVKFEIGAYRFGLKYLGNNINKYDYIIFTQDTFILKNKYDFNNLVNDNINACTIYKHIERPFLYGTDTIVKDVLEKINIYDKLDEITFCWCVSFILHKDVINNFLKLTDHININIRKESEASERYMARILYQLNNFKNYDIDGYLNDIKYDIWTADMFNNDEITKNYYFQKRPQQKNENT